MLAMGQEAFSQVLIELKFIRCELKSQHFYSMTVLSILLGKTSRTAEQLAELAISSWCCRSEIPLVSVEGRGSRLWWLWYTWCSSFQRLT